MSKRTFDEAMDIETENETKIVRSDDLNTDVKENGCYLDRNGALYFVPENPSDQYLAWQGFFLARGIQVDYWQQLINTGKQLPNTIQDCKFFNHAKRNLVVDIISQILHYEKSFLHDKFMFNQYRNNIFIGNGSSNEIPQNNFMRVSSQEGCIKLRSWFAYHLLTPRNLSYFARKFLQGQWMNVNMNLWSVCKAMHTLVMIHALLKLDQRKRFKEMFPELQIFDSINDQSPMGSFFGASPDYSQSQ